MSDYDNPIAEIRSRLKRLDNLLADPHPGLHTWGAAYIDAVNSILAFYSKWEGDNASVDN